MLSPLPSVGSTLSMYAGPTESVNTYRDLDDVTADTSHGLPPIKGTYNHSMISPKITVGHVPINFQRSHRLNTPKVHRTKPMKAVKGTKNIRAAAFPDLSPKGSLGVYKPGEPPPYKKRANSKYVSPYSQRYLGQSPSIF
ncbi:hypothetical protein GOP47_0017143 [Adiantum capillus-veneris]|uniref:Uncharacterized protein n=1 Tax=Adiantum capillus-veneris TaxID=13818 RepID=A0A9D4ZAZ2_ADICA|nr:hypothetical protein GOP47_0017143 [Adiantum capillus-veneris]